MDTTSLKNKIAALLEDEDDPHKVQRIRPISQDHPPAPGEKLIKPSNPQDTHDSVRALQDLQRRLRAGKGQPVGSLVQYLNPIVALNDMIRAIDLIFQNHIQQRAGLTGGQKTTIDLVKEMFADTISDGKLNVVWKRAVTDWAEKRTPQAGPKFTGDY